MKYFSFFLFLILANLFTQAQSAGYMGKRMQMSYAFNTSPAIFGATANNTSILGTSGSAETGEFALNMIHEGSLEFMPSSKWVIGAGLRYYKTAYDNAAEMSSSSFYYASYDNGYRPDGYYTIKGLSYALYFKYFGKRYVAPWGRYVMFGPVFNTYKTEYDPSIMYLKATKYSSYYYEEDTIIRDFGSKEQSYKGFNVLLGWGRSRVVANRVTIDYGCNFQLFSVLSTFFDFEGVDLFNEYTNTNSNYIERTVRKRVRGVNRFNVFFKVGVLLF